MIEFGNLYGLWALLALPLILILHFFRHQRKVIRIGGLHLWDFAKQKLPSGNKWVRLNRSIPLLLQLLIALLISLLLCDPHINLEKKSKHYFIILDNTASMQAGKDRPFMDEAKKVILDFLTSKDRYTIILAGEDASILSGPSASANTVREKLKTWHPDELELDLENALNFTEQLNSSPNHPLFITDNPDIAESFKDSLYVYGIGTPLDNCGFIYADRFQVDKENDFITLVLFNFSDKNKSITLKGLGNGKQEISQEVELLPQKNTPLKFKVPHSQIHYRFEISNDNYALDNSVLLVPSNIQTVHIALEGVDKYLSSFEKAFNIIPYTKITEAANAHLLITSSSNITENKTLRKYQFHTGLPKEEVNVASEKISINKNHPLMRNILFEGVLWGYKKEVDKQRYVLARHEEVPLLYRTFQEGKKRHFTVNLDMAYTNITKTASWPVFLLNIVEECRSNIRELQRHNYKKGERINLSFPTNPEEKFILSRESKIIAEHEFPPPFLDNLEKGLYTIEYGENNKHIFAVNTFSAQESDLTTAKHLKCRLSKIQQEYESHSRKNQIAYYILLILLICTVGALWKYQTLYR